MDTQKAAEELTVIRQLMERPIRFSTMSGLAAIQAGLWVLVGVAGDHWVFSHYSGAAGLIGGAIVWGGVFVLAFVGVVLLTWRRERKQGMPLWSPIKRRILTTILPPFVAAVGLTLAIGIRCLHAYADAGAGPREVDWTIAQGMLIPAIWMLFYGIALWQLGQFSPVEVKVLGAAFIAAGLATALLWQWQPYWAMGVTFGGFHIVYGIAVWIRHGG
ncbi:MAG: hypothetical protein ACYS8X_13715 [Planctomycetota bacterium]|jgi:hypothetical protein